MSLFDTIRYPISTPPTSEELSRLPRRLFYSWCACIQGSYPDPSFMSGYMSEYMKGPFEYLSDEFFIDMNRLHKLILDYDNI